MVTGFVFWALVLLQAMPGFALSAAGSQQDSGLSSTVEQVLAQNPRLYNLGVVDGKAFLMDNSTQRDWYRSYAFCGDSGMSMATIRSQEQHDFLVSKFEVLQKDVPYWVNARLKSGTEPYGWDGDSNQQVENYSNAWGFTGYMALYYVADSSSLGYLRSAFYTSLNYVLCEIA